MARSIKVIMSTEKIFNIKIGLNYSVIYLYPFKFEILVSPVLGVFFIFVIFKYAIELSFSKHFG